MNTGLLGSESPITICPADPAGDDTSELLGWTTRQEHGACDTNEAGKRGYIRRMTDGG